jgi:hypothetical protein
VLQAHKENKDQLDHKESQVPQGGLALQVSVVLQAHKVLLGLQAGLAHEVSQDHKVLLGLQDGQVLQGLLVLQGLKVIKVLPDPQDLTLQVI